MTAVSFTSKSPGNVVKSWAFLLDRICDTLASRGERRDTFSILLDACSFNSGLWRRWVVTREGNMHWGLNGVNPTGLFPASYEALVTTEYGVIMLLSGSNSTLLLSVIIRD
ncbi:unnamed protein product [Trichobilharzia regenti]|nr:unnamed protein product [Trichobilharzia regenti]